MADLQPSSPLATLTRVPGWGVVRASNFGAAVGDPHRWPGPRQLYRASGLSPMQYESAGKRRDGSISREGSGELRRALIDLGIGLWLNDPDAKAYGQAMRARGKSCGVIACAMTNRGTGSPSPWSATTPTTTPRAGTDTRPEHPSQHRHPVENVEPTKGRIRCRCGYGGRLARYAESSLAPGASPSQQPERRQMTQPA